MQATIGKYITTAEATKSQTAERLCIDNSPSASQLAAMVLVATKCYDPVCEHFGVKRIGVSSFLRVPKLNKAVGGAAGSQHEEGEAIDIDSDMVAGGPENWEVFDFIRSNCEFDQLIWEFGDDRNPAWVHVSYNADGKNRRQVLKAVKVGKATKYMPF